MTFCDLKIVFLKKKRFVSFVTYPFLVYIALFLILSTFYEEVHNQDLVIAPKKLSTLFLFIKKMEKTYNYSTKNIPVPSIINYN